MPIIVQRKINPGLILIILTGLIFSVRCSNEKNSSLLDVLQESQPVQVKNTTPEINSTNKSDECNTPPEGMVCVPGGYFIMGEEGEGEEGEGYFKPHRIYVRSFYIDKYEVTNEEFSKCIEAGFCSQPIKYKGFTSPEQPALPVTWYNAEGYCRWAGKRLPTEAEWEKAAKGPEGGKYPWGNNPPDCSKAAYRDCNLQATKPVGSYPPNGYGIYDMAGNSYEWVKDWYAPCIDGCEKACGENCLKENPAGPCDGQAPCEGFTMKVLKGGSWYWGSEALATSWRRPMPPLSGVHRLGFRCAKDIDNSLPKSEIFPLSQSEFNIFLSSPEDDVPEVRVDERHYYHSNENAHEFFFPFIKNTGGGYLGVGADQNYTLIAIARPDLAWIVDYDSVVIDLHKIHKLLILHSDNPDEFINYWKEENKDKTINLIKESFDEKLASHLTNIFIKSRPSLSHYFEILRTKKRGNKPVSWLSDIEMFDFIKKMFIAGRIRTMLGNLVGERALKGIGNTARELGVTIRTIYLTNVEEFIRYDSNFKEWIKAIPVDSKSVILRTACSYQGFEKGDYRWHYNIQSTESFLEILDKGFLKVQGILKFRQPTSIPGVSTIGL